MENEEIPRFKMAFGALFIIAVIGLAAYAIQIQRGLIVTNLRNPFSWGLYIIMWAFYVGLAAGGLVVSSAIYLFGAKDLKPVAPVASTTAFLFAIAALLSILPDIGRPDRILNIFLYPNFTSMIVWDVIVLTVYALLSFVYTYIQLRPNIAKYGIDLPIIRSIFKGGATDEEVSRLKESSEKWAKIIAPIALPFAILIHTVTAWVLATQLSRPWWYGGLLAPTFIAAAIASGPIAVIFASVIKYGTGPEYMKAYKTLAKISGVSTFGLLFMYYNDFVVRAWWGYGSEYEALRLLFEYYIPIHAIEITFMLIGAIVLLKYSDKIKMVLAGGAVLIVGVLAHRFALIPSAYNLIPFRVPVVSQGEVIEWSYPIAVGEIRGDLLSPELVFVSYWNYFPSIYEIAISAGMTAIVLLILLILLKYVPYSMREKHEPAQ